MKIEQNSTTSKKLDEKIVEPGNTRFEWTPAMKEFRKCRRCGKEFDETNDMIFHMKKEHVNFVKSVQNGKGKTQRRTINKETVNILKLWQCSLTLLMFASF